MRFKILFSFLFCVFEILYNFLKLAWLTVKKEHDSFVCVHVCVFH